MERETEGTRKLTQLQWKLPHVAAVGLKGATRTEHEGWMNEVRDKTRCTAVEAGIT
jgi:hypothetical protein